MPCSNDLVDYLFVFLYIMNHEFIPTQLSLVIHSFICRLVGALRISKCMGLMLHDAQPLIYGL